MDHLDPDVMYYNHMVREGKDPREFHSLPISPLAKFDALDDRGQAEAIVSAQDKIASGSLDEHTIDSNCSCGPIRESTGAVPHFIHRQSVAAQ
jgi:hypothetical protein